MTRVHRRGQNIRALLRSLPLDTELVVQADLRWFALQGRSTGLHALKRRIPHAVGAMALWLTMIACQRRVPIPLPESLRSLRSPKAGQALGTAIMHSPSDNVIAVHLLDGSVVQRREDQILPTPDEWVVPHIGPLRWPAVFAVEQQRLWIWTDGEWAWLDRPDVGFVAWSAAAGTDHDADPDSRQGADSHSR